MGAHASAPPPPPPVSRGQEDRPPPLPRALPEGEGQRVQEQARPHGVHPQEEGRDAPELPEGGGAAGSGRRGAAEEVGGGRVSATVLLFAFTSANRKMINIHAIC